MKFEDKDNAIHTLLWLGPGAQPTFDRLIENVKQIVIYEPDEKALSILKEKYKSSQHVTLKSDAITNKPSVKLKCYGVENVASIQSPKDLYLYYPNIKAERSLTVSGKSIAASIAELGLTTSNNAIVVDVNDLAIDLLTVLSDEAIRNNFKWIVVRGSEKQLFNKSLSLSDIEERFTNYDYIEVETIKIDNISSYLVFKINPLFYSSFILKNEFNNLKKQHAELVQSFDKLKYNYKEDLTIISDLKEKLEKLEILTSLGKKEDG